MRLPAYYRIGVILAILPLIIGFSTLVGTPHSISDGILYAKFFLNLFVGASVWAWYLIVIMYFDKRMPWESTKHSYRWVRQLGISLPIGAIIYILTISIRNILIDWTWSPHLAFYTDLPIALTLSVGIQFLHQQWYLRAQKEFISPPKIDPQISTVPIIEEGKPLTLQSGNTTLILQPEEIALFHREEQLNYLYLIDGTRHRLELSISALETQVSDEAFFRVNRQCLVNRSAIQSFEVLPSRQISLQLSSPQAIRPLINKNRSATFKQWLQKATSKASKEVSAS